MEFLGMIAVGIIGLVACGRLFGLLMKMMGVGLDKLEAQLIGGGKKRTNRVRFLDDDDDDDY